MYSKIKFAWNEKKRRTNVREHGLDFTDAIELFEQPGILSEELDLRKNYGESRYIGYGSINNRLMVVVYTKRKPNIIRIISFRRANKREQKKNKNNDSKTIEENKITN